MGDIEAVGRSGFSRRRSPWATAAALLSVAVVGCDDGGTEPAETPDLLRLEAVWGDGESGLPGERLRNPVVVLVTDARARPAPGVPVRFEPAEGSGSAEPSSAVSDNHGRVMVHWRLDPSGVRRQQLRATIDEAVAGGGAQVVLEATALGPDEVDRIEVREALGPLKGIVLVWVEEAYSVLFEKATADTVVLLPPLPLQGAPALDLLVFSHGNRPLMKRVFLTAAVDTVRVTLRPPVLVDLNVSVKAGVFEELRPLFEADLGAMEDLWARNAMGLRLGRVTWADTTGGEGWNVDGSNAMCDALLPGQAIEVSIVGSVQSSSTGGYGCMSGHVFLGRQWYRYQHLLAHEVGHTFSLYHTSWGLMNPSPPFGGDLRTGQVFRSHFDLRSSLNTIFGAQHEAQRRLCGMGPDSACLLDEFEFSESVPW